MVIFKRRLAFEHILLTNGNPHAVTSDGITFDGDEFNNVFDGNNNDNIMRGYAGDDTIGGLGGKDTISGGEGNDYIDGGSDNDWLYGGVQNDTIYGGSGNDRIEGESGSDYLNGGDGENIIIGGADSDTIIGGSGKDVINAGMDNAGDVVFGGDGENSIAGSGGNDRLTGGKDKDYISGFGGNDTIVGGGGGSTDGLADLLQGGTGNDYIVGGSLTDNIYGDEDNDRLEGLGGKDYLWGGTGNDSIDGGAGNDIINGGTGTDTLKGGEGDDLFDWRISIDGPSGGDRMEGGAGSDTYYIDDANDVVVETDANSKTGGIDIVVAYITHKLTANVETLYIMKDGLQGTGNELDNIISGFDGTQRLLGGDGDDSLYGGAGNDYLSGGNDADLLVGGAGADTINGGAGVDTIDYGAETKDLTSYTGIKVDLRSGAATDPTGAKDSVALVERFIGTAKVDTFIAGDGLLAASSFEGGGGDDDFTVNVSTTPITDQTTVRNVFVGGTGNDTFHLGTTRVLIKAGDGKDTLDATKFDFRKISGEDGLTINLETGKIAGFYGSAGNGKIYGQIDDAEHAIGTARNDFLQGNAADNWLRGMDGRDYLDGGKGNDRLEGGDGLDFYFDSEGNDTYTDNNFGFLTFKNSTKSIYLDPAARVATGNGTDRFSYGLNEFQLTKYKDTLVNGGINLQKSDWGYASMVDMGAGDDLIIQRPNVSGSKTYLDVSDRTIYGGAGMDTVDLSQNQQGVAIGASTTERADNDVNSYDPYAGQYVSLFYITDVAFESSASAYFSAENFIGTDFGDVFSQRKVDISKVTDTNRDNIVRAGKGNDKFYGIFGNDTLDGGAGTDSLALYESNIITSDRSALTIDLQTGIARLGGWKTSIISIENVTGGKGDDAIYGNASANVLKGGIGNDTLAGGLGNDTLDGGDGVDSASFARSATSVTVDLTKGKATGEGTDTLKSIENVIGSAKNDTFIGTTGSNQLDGGAGFDTIDYSISAKKMTIDLQKGTATGHGTDKLIGIENIIGSKYDDEITGSSSNNSLNGGAGDDWLDGDTGLDRLTGGAGRDTFVFDKRDAIDVVTDFKPVDDTLAIDNAMFVKLTSLLLDGPLSAHQFVRGKDPVATRDAQFLYETDTGILRFDADGPGGTAAIKVLELANHASITAADIFIL